MTRSMKSAAVLLATLACGAALGQVGGAAPSTAGATPHPVQMVTYASGLTGFYDAVAGMYYVYDANLENVVLVRQVTTLGEPMKRLKN